MMNILSILLYVVVSQQLCYGDISYGDIRMRSFGALDMRTRQMYSFKGLPEFPNLADDEKREVFSYQQNIIVRCAGLLDNKVRHCQVIDVYKEDEAEKVSKELESKLKLKLQKVNMKIMMALLAECDSVDEWDVHAKPDKESVSPNALINGIFPGTKWCGLGNIANNYHDLGKLHNVDKCCRSHDYCPMSVASRDTRYNLTNKSYYTKSHCLCDKVFYNCLKKDNGWTAKFIGYLYFYAASPQCIKGVPENSGEIVEFIPAPNKW